MKKDHNLVRYSQAFKAEVVDKIQRGELSIGEAKETYGINGGSTIYRWVQQAGRHELIRKVVQVRTSKEVDEIKRLKRELEQAKRALADAHIEGWVKSELYQYACEHLGVDPEEFKKKAGVDSSGRARP
jgi:transposase-like protein